MPTITVTIQHPKTEEDIDIEVEFEVTSAEPDVGIMSWGIEDEIIVGEYKDLNKEISQRQWDIIREKIYSSYDPYDTADDQYDYDLDRDAP